MREKYTNNIAYLFKRIKADNTISYVEMGLPFYCNKEFKNKRSLNAMTGLYMNSASKILKTTTQIDFGEHDRISFVSNPTDDNYSMIVSIDIKPLYGRGNKHNSVTKNEYWITIS